MQSGAKLSVNRSVVAQIKKPHVDDVYHVVPALAIAHSCICGLFAASCLAKISSSRPACGLQPCPPAQPKWYVRESGGVHPYNNPDITPIHMYVYIYISMCMFLPHYTEIFLSILIYIYIYTTPIRTNTHTLYIYIYMIYIYIYMYMFTYIYIYISLSLSLPLCTPEFL